MNPEQSPAKSEPAQPLRPRHKRPFWRLCRIYFRRFRITVWLIVLILVAALAYLDLVGLPDFVKRPLLERLRAHGMNLQFSRLRLSWFHGFVADNVQFGEPGEPLAPQLTLREIRVHLDYKALAHLRFQIDSLHLRQGRLVWSVTQTNQPTRQLAIDDLQTQLRFLPNDLWALDHFTANFAGAKIQLSGMITNASAIRDWEMFGSQAPAAPGDWQNRLRQLADVLDQIHFPQPPDLKLDVRGDARDRASFTVRMVLSAPGAETPWGRFTRGRLTARILPATSNETLHADVTLEAHDAKTRWATTANLFLTGNVALVEGQTNWANANLLIRAGQAQSEWAGATNLELTLHLAPVPGQSNLINGDLACSATQAGSQWASATNALFTAHWIHALTNPIPLSGQGQLDCSQARTDWGTARHLQFSAQLAAASQPPPADESWAWWAKLQPFLLDWQGRITDFESPKIALEQVALAGRWNAPELTITNFYANLYGGFFHAYTHLNVATRDLAAQVATDVDPHEVSSLLTRPAQHWLEAFAWGQSPQVNGDAALVLPPWNTWSNLQSSADWRADVQPTLRLQGELNFPRGGAYRGLSITAAHSHFAYSNFAWQVPDLLLKRPEGQVQAELRADERTQEFYSRVSSTIDPAAARPLLATNQQRGLDYFVLTQPPVLEAEVWGRGTNADYLRVKGRVALTNFSFRGESVAAFQTGFDYSNRLILATGPHLWRGEGGTQQLSATTLLVDIPADRIIVTNGFGTADLGPVTRAIGLHVARAMEPYQFSRPPTVLVRGIIPLHGENADLYFDILDGGPFHWWKFNLLQVTGRVHWLGQYLTLHEIQTEFYGGQAAGFAEINFHPKNGGTELRFAATVTNSQLNPLMADLKSGTNRFEGTLSGSLNILYANTAQEGTVLGSGSLSLRDGLIWDAPIFGIFSPVLNGLNPGLGNSRANAGTCTFSITNSLIHTEDLVIQARSMRLSYRGTVDFDRRVNARVEAGLFKNVWLLGPFVSTVAWPVTKLFEYKVTGSLDDPKATPVFLISKIVLLPFQMPFHPLRTLKDLLPEDPASRTNMPPFKTQP